MLRWLVLLSFLFASQVSALVTNEASVSAFGHLKGLIGDWRSSAKDSSTVVNYKTVANGTALVETWTMSPTRQSMTVYTMDGDRLIATHYCPQGNAPRMALTSIDEAGAYRFLFLDGTNLQDPAGSHEHAFWVRIDSAGSITRSETYIGNAVKYDPSTEKGSEETFTRVQ